MADHEYHSQKTKPKFWSRGMPEEEIFEYGVKVVDTFWEGQNNPNGDTYMNLFVIDYTKPYLTPIRTTSANVRHAAYNLGELRSVLKHELGVETRRNDNRLFEPVIHEAPHYGPGGPQFYNSRDDDGSIDHG